MKRTLILITLALACTALSAQSQKFPGLDPSPLDVAFFPGNSANAEFRGPRVEAKIKLYYSRPQLKDRELSKLVPDGKMWRFGANEASEITFYSDVTVGNKTVKAGTYAVFIDVKGNNWDFVLHSKLNTWGNFLMDGSQEVARVAGAISTNSDSVEALSVAFKEVDGGAHMVVGWGNTIAEMPIKF
ncbi:DUF2911 domain-containing protein [Roseivirga sp. E12]|uniref:DUF2911 domain-containing protein n=1 Tax=Roseivirga sp. E12 TaxID=2819237 RepID=UPI001ABBE4AA|nr:DUF2911 domain-containing protein [Roseivirga sp. E12]MBO3697055.1 DUF2911 domain-containing protein [Roseivirga sp. E12]